MREDNFVDSAEIVTKSLSELLKQDRAKLGESSREIPYI